MRLSLATKIFFGFSMMLAVFGAVPIFGIAQLNTVRERLNLLNRGYLPLNRVVADVETLQESTRRSLDGILKFDNMELQRPLLLNIRRSFARNMTNRLERGHAVLIRLDRSELNEEDQRFLTTLDGQLERIRGRSTEFQDALRTIEQSLEETPLPATELAQATELQKIGRGLARDVRIIKLALKNVITSQMLLIERDQSSAIGVIIWLTILAVGVGILITFLSLLALRPIRRLAEAARNISRGDFSPVMDVSSQDEFGLLANEFNRMAHALAQREEELVGQKEQVSQANRQLRQSSIDLALMKLYSEHIIRSMPNGILVADALGEVTTINPAAEALWRLQPGEVIGRKLEDLSIGSVLKDMSDSWAKVLRGQERVVFEAVEFEISERGQVLVDLHFSPLMGTDGEVHGVLVVGEDVTERVSTKQALLRSERLATIGRMSAMVAHEIRNPLSSIGLNTELLQEEIETPGEDSAEEARAILMAISREVERLVEVTDEYLRFARLPKPHLSPENLNQLIEDLLNFMRSELEDAGVELRFQPDPQVSRVPADEGQLRQAFLNLLKNSAESMPEGGVLTVRTEQANGLSRVVISDTGKGIDASSLGRIFDPFFSTRDGGTGLGLSLTQQIVNDHGGQITCQSSPGEGTSFLVDLPVSKMDPADQDGSRH